MPAPTTLQAAVDRLAAIRAKMGPKTARLSPIPVQDRVKLPDIGPKRDFPRLSRPVPVEEAIKHWWADPEK